MAVLLVGVTLTHQLTDGFEAFTLESARRVRALQAPMLNRDLALELAEGRPLTLGDMPGQVLLVDFIYTRCPTLCLALGATYKRLGEALSGEIASGAVKLVSVSFDPDHDTPQALDSYRARFAPALRQDWIIGRPQSAGATRAWLDAFGVIVIPDRYGGFAHNAAVHIVDSRRRLVAITDPNDVDAIVRLTRRTLAGESLEHVAQN
jgi:protein SCO1/2